MKLMEMLDVQGDYVTNLVKKLAPPLVTLLSAEPEIQYVALRNINLIVQKRFVYLKTKFCETKFSWSGPRRLFGQILVKKLAPPLVTLLSAEPEIQYVALRNTNLIVQKRYVLCQDKVRLKFLPHLLIGLSHMSV